MAMIANSPDPYAWWHSAVADPSAIGKTLPVDMNAPQPGFYRTKRGDAVAIWYEEGALVAVEDGRRVDPVDIWSWCAKTPVPYEYHVAKRDTGRWPDDPPIVTMQHTEIAGIGHNTPPDEFSMLKSEIEGNAEIVKDFLKKPITDQTAADQAGTWAKKMTELRGKAEKARKIEKAPHLEAERAVDAKYNPLVDAADQTAAALKRLLKPWLDEQDRLEQERQRKAREEAARIRREAEEAAERAAEAARSIEDVPLDMTLDPDVVMEIERAEAEAQRKADELAQAEAEAQARKVNAGRTGAKVSFKEYKIGKITDPDAFLQAVKDQKEIVEAMEKIVGRFARNGVTVPGMKIETEKRPS